METQRFRLSNWLRGCQFNELHASNMLLEGQETKRDVLSHLSDPQITSLRTYHFKQEADQLLRLAPVFRCQGRGRHIEECCSTFCSNSFREHCFASARRTNHQHALKGENKGIEQQIKKLCSWYSALHLNMIQDLYSNYLIT